MSGKPGFKAVSAMLCALLFCVEYTGGYVGAGFDAFRRVTDKTSFSPRGGGQKKSTTVPTYPEETIISSNFDIRAELVSAVAAPPNSDSFGVFRMTCAGGQITRDDLVAYPAQPGKSHLQQFFGNESATAYSTYASLRGGGNSTCMSPVDRSHYSVPAMLDGRGNMVRPDFMTIAFKRRTASDTTCQSSGGTGSCIAFPNGLRFVFGYDPATPTERAGNPRFSCEGATAAGGEYSTITQIAVNCPSQPSNGVYNKLVATIDSPSCWDGKNLDSADHRSHMAYPADGWQSGVQCPSTHPFQIPALSLSIRYTVDDGLANWRLSSDEMVQGAQPGTTFRATWIGAWDNQVMGMWVQNCINKNLACPNANLGNRKAIRAGASFVTTAAPRLVPLEPLSPAPTPTPAPAPSPTHIQNKVAAEGDSISVYGNGMYPKVYDDGNSNVSVCGLAVGGSNIITMTSRISGVSSCNGEVVTVLIGANDLLNYSSGQAWANALWGYTDKLRAQGFKVAVATLLPRIAGNPANQAPFNARRAEVNAMIRAAVGAHTDAVIDFAADPRIGDDDDALNTALYPDGLHPSGQGHAIMATIYAPVVDGLLAR